MLLFCLNLYAHTSNSEAHRYFQAFFFTLSRFFFVHLKDEGEDHIYREISILVGNNVTLNLRLIIT